MFYTGNDQIDNIIMVLLQAAFVSYKLNMQVFLKDLTK